MKLYPANAQCDCEADTTSETSVMARRCGEWNGLLGVAARIVWTIHRAKKTYHYRDRDQAHYWHWSDQEVIKI